MEEDIARYYFSRPVNHDRYIKKEKKDRNKETKEERQKNERERKENMTKKTNEC